MNITLPQWLINLIILAILVSVVTVIITVATVVVLGAFKRMLVAKAEQLSSTVGLVSYPDGSAERFNKDTGESYTRSGGIVPDFGTLLIIGIVAIAGIIVIQLVTTGKSSVLTTLETGATKTIGAVERAGSKLYHTVAD